MYFWNALRMPDLPRHICADHQRYNRCLLNALVSAAIYGGRYHCHRKKYSKRQAAEERAKRERGQVLLLQDPMLARAEIHNT